MTSNLPLKNGFSKEQHPWLAGILVLRLWLIPAGFLLGLKYLVLGNYLGLASGGGFAEVTRIWGLELSPLQKFAFYRDDIFITLLLIPAVLLLILRFLPRRAGHIFMSALSIVTVTFVLIQVKSYLVAGQFLSYGAMRDAVVWAVSEPGARAAYVSSRELAAVAFFLLATLAAAFLNAYHARQVMADPRSTSRWQRAAVFYAVVMCAALLVAALPRLPRTPFQTSSAQQSLHAFAGESDANTSAYKDLTDQELFLRFYAMAGSPPAERDPAYWGREVDSNLIFFILETTPYRCLPVEGDLANTPNLQKLRDHSFVAPNHYATYVFTSRNLFSIFTAWYPSSRRRESLERYPGERLPGIVQALRARGYKSAVYAPVHDLFALQDEKLFHALGFQGMRYAAEFYADGTKEDYREGWRTKLQNDRKSLSLMMADIDSWAKSGDRFVTAFLPQLGHAPWPDILEKKNPDRVERCRQLAHVQDQWLGELTEHLRSKDLLSKTVIVLLSDHGVRNQSEDPALPRVVIDDYSYHVPLVIYAPQTLKSPQQVSGLTSHIDISPTLLDLYGVQEERLFPQGLPLWDKNLRSRKLFLMANSFSMTDAVVNGQTYTLCNYGTGAVYESTSLAFPDSTLIPGRDINSEKNCDLLTDFRGLQTVWLERVVRK